MRRGFERAGLACHPNLVAILSQARDDRPPCNGCNGCLRSCPISDKGSVDVTFLRSAVATGRCSIRAGCEVLRLETGPDDTITGVVVAERGRIERLAAPRTWWSWSADDVLRFTVPTAEDTLSTTIAHDTDGAWTYNICGVTGASTFTASLPAIGTTNLSLGSSEVSSATPVVWTVESLAGQFSLDGYRIYFANGTLNGTGPGPLNQTSVVDSGDLGGGSKPDIDTAKGTYLLSEVDADTVSTNFDGGTLTVAGDREWPSSARAGTSPRPTTASRASPPPA